MFDVSLKPTPSSISNLFIPDNHMHQHKTIFSSSGNFYVKTSRLYHSRGSFARFSAEIWNSLQNEVGKLSKHAFKNRVQSPLFSVTEDEDDYVEASI